ncbi:hypothetical protein T492DRAFT_1036055 [Pavlovales sp. CCMP2436]|nr:hypothetical protein T492DRAFT_1036055 [Pavlovales sp. CCMP2436]
MTVVWILVLLVAVAPLADAHRTMRNPKAVLGMVRSRLTLPAAKPAAPLALMPLIIPGVHTISDASLFPLVNLVLPAWLCLIFLPRWKYTKPVVKYTAVVFAALYVALLVPVLCSSAGLLSQFTSLDGIVNLFSKPSAVLVGWIHFVAFDLWTAQWIVADANKIHSDRVGNLWRVPHYAVAPTLVGTFLFGPAGLLAYLAMRGAFFAYRKSSLVKRPGSYY